jgi:protein TonB
MTPRARKLGLWILSLLVVFGVHAALFLWALYWRPAELPEQPEPAAVMIQLAPLPVAPPPAPPEPVVIPEPEPEPEVVEAPKPKLVIAKPTPKPKPKPPEPKPEPPKPLEPTPPAPPAPPAPPSPEPPAERAPAASTAAPASDTSNAEAIWKAKLMARLKRYEDYPEDARRRRVQGTVTLRFAVDANGRVSAPEVVQSSGNRSLDRAALRQVRRAQPMPKPAAELLRDGKKEVIAPFTYQLDRGH